MSIFISVFYFEIISRPFESEGSGRLGPGGNESTTNATGAPFNDTLPGEEEEVVDNDFEVLFNHTSN